METSHSPLQLSSIKWKSKQHLRLPKLSFKGNFLICSRHLLILRLTIKPSTSTWILANYRIWNASKPRGIIDPSLPWSLKKIRAQPRSVFLLQSSLPILYSLVARSLALPLFFRQQQQGRRHPWKKGRRRRSQGKAKRTAFTGIENDLVESVIKGADSVHVTYCSTMLILWKNHTSMILIPNNAYG